MRIHFTRHGESQANLLHEISNRGLRHGLTSRGREQAMILAGRLQGLPVARIYSSPLLRAIETSVILANQLRVEFEVTDGLKEYDCGVLEGRSDQSAWRGWQELFEAWTIQGQWERRMEGGENFIEVRSRFQKFIENLVNQYGTKPEDVVCVGHGGVYRLMLPLVLRNVDADLISQYGIDYTTRIVAESRIDGLYCVEWNGHKLGRTGTEP